MTHSLKPSLGSLTLLKTSLKTSLEKVTWHIQAEDEDIQPIVPWADETIEQIALFSQYLLKNKAAKKHPELVALGYWCRKSHLKTIQAEFQALENSAQRNPQGKVFHIAPANVDTVFFYSLLLSLLSGNHNIVRISERSGELCRLLIQLFQQFLQSNNAPSLKTLVSIVEYSASHITATKLFSQWCNLRVVWGGDSAIEAISNIAPETPQLSFPDRFSIAVIQLTDNELAKIPEITSNFIADFLPFNQQACSSPKALFWLNTQENLQQKFYDELILQLAKHPQQFGLSEQVERQINLQALLFVENVKMIKQSFAEQLALLELSHINAGHLIQHSGNGLLLAQNINTKSELPFDEKLQTITEYGLTDKDINNISVCAYKRVVNLGSALEFDHVWDGVNLTKALTK